MTDMTAALFQRLAVAAAHGVTIAAFAAGSAFAAPPAVGPRVGGEFADATSQARDGRTVRESERLSRAKALIADEEWSAAMSLLREAVADPAERDRDEALFWLAQAQAEAGDLGEAVRSIVRLQRDHAGTRWARPAMTLLIELAQRLGREDILWRTAAPPPPPPPPPPPAPAHVAPAPPPPPPAPEAGVWLPAWYRADADLQVQALGWLMRREADKAIPLLRTIALDGARPDAARRAVFVLAQSRHPTAETTVLDAAREGPEPVRIAAVRELGRFGGPESARQLLEVYETGSPPVKQQVVAALALRTDAPRLLQIARTERDRALRTAAIVALGRAQGHEQLRALYPAVRAEFGQAVIVGLFNARDDEGLIAIAEREREPSLREEVLARLRLMGTPRATAFLQRVK